MRCSRCKLCWYCSLHCQREHFPEHKESCKEIKRLMDEVQREYEKLIHPENDDPNDIFGFQGNPFEEGVGDFWLILETRNYCRARNSLASELYRVAFHAETLQQWELVLGHQLELLRLIRRDNIGIRYSVPFVLLYLNRDDCLDFLNHWYLDCNEESDNDELHATSNPGDWWYGRTPNARFMSIFDKNPKLDPKSFSLPLFVALLLVKRIVAAIDARVKSFGLFSKMIMASKLCADTLGRIREHLVGSAKVYQEQNRQIT